ncbi:hypothetical protein AALP_AA4G061400 [Arabis alpina]|uniref:Uncharacterized protein n=1 Tax=Arabis alpina TaxID=50452 RepID=A0A087H1G7_ARAAL|nr:hypothetical protein AALP_AA4G061400 [Arabis alpina]
MSVTKNRVIEFVREDEKRKQSRDDDSKQRCLNLRRGEEEVECENGVVLIEAPRLTCSESIGDDDDEDLSPSSSSVEQRIQEQEECVNKKSIEEEEELEEGEFRNDDVLRESCSALVKQSIQEEGECTDDDVLVEQQSTRKRLRDGEEDLSQALVTTLEEEEEEDVFYKPWRDSLGKEQDPLSCSPSEDDIAGLILLQLYRQALGGHKRRHYEGTLGGQNRGHNDVSIGRGDKASSPPSNGSDVTNVSDPEQRHKELLWLDLNTPAVDGSCGRDVEEVESGILAIKPLQEVKNGDFLSY